MPATAAAAVTVAPETLTITWLVAGGIIAELLILIVFLVRVAWWLSHRFTLIDATLAGNAKEIGAIKIDVSNDIAGRKVVAEARTDIAQIKATLGEFRERIDRFEATRTGASTPDPPPQPNRNPTKARPSGGLRRFRRSQCCLPNTDGSKPSPARA
jgi:hypothetical protein